MPVTYESIASTTLTSATATVSFSSISGSYTDLILVTGDITNGTNLATLYVQLNDDTATNYSYTYVEGATSTTVASSRQTSQTKMELARSYGGDRTQNTLHFLNYANTTTYKTVLCRFGSGGTSSNAGWSAGLWRKTPEAITKITLGITGTINFAIGCSFSLYGIKAA